MKLQRLLVSDGGVLAWTAVATGIVAGRVAGAVAGATYRKEAKVY